VSASSSMTSRCCRRWMLGWAAGWPRRSSTWGRLLGSTPQAGLLRLSPEEEHLKRTAETRQGSWWDLPPRAGRWAQKIAGRPLSWSLRPKVVAASLSAQRQRSSGAQSRYSMRRQAERRRCGPSYRLTLQAPSLGPAAATVSEQEALRRSRKAGHRSEGCHRPTWRRPTLS
jgi:hypothetical protein